MPPEWQEQLGMLQDKAPPFAPEEVRAIVVHELGREPEQVFRHFNYEPISAASIGQVHHAIHSNGEEVAVKVQRPEITEQLESDLIIMHELAHWLEQSTSWAANYNLVGIVEEFRQSIHDELDYGWEARNADKLREHMQSLDGVYIPRVYWDVTTSKVLTMEYVHGAKINHIDELQQARVNLVATARTFTDSMVRQILVHGFFHADPHPGNILVNRETGRIIFLDLGMMGTLREDEREALANLLLASQQADSAELTRIVMEIGIVEGEVDEHALHRDLERLLNHYFKQMLSELSMADMLTDMLSIFFDHGIRLPSSLTLSIKAIIQMQEIATTLHPDIQLVDIVQAVQEEKMAESYSMLEMVQGLYQRINALMSLEERFSEFIDGARDLVKGGKFTIEIDTPGLPQQMQILNAIANRLTTGLTLAGITIGSAIAMRASSNNEESFVFRLGVFGYFISLLLSVGVVLRGLWAMRQAPEEYEPEPQQARRRRRSI
jgi:ubiquinone biosynthesis protein